MCGLKDYADLDLLPSHRRLLEDELVTWHKTYLPVKGGCVLDVGAGCGETARLYLLHGARRVIALEADPDAYARLVRNFAHDDRVVPILARVSDVKVDIEGSEDGMTVEWHGQRREQVIVHPLDANVWMSTFHVVVCPHVWISRFRMAGVPQRKFRNDPFRQVLLMARRVRDRVRGAPP